MILSGNSLKYQDKNYKINLIRDRKKKGLQNPDHSDPDYIFFKNINLDQIGLDRIKSQNWVFQTRICDPDLSKIGIWIW